MTTEDLADRQSAADQHDATLADVPAPDRGPAIAGRYQCNVVVPGASTYRTLILTEVGTYQYTCNVRVTVNPIWADEAAAPPWTTTPPSSTVSSGLWSPVPNTDPLRIALRPDAASQGSPVFMTLICNGNTLTAVDARAGEVWRRTGPPIPVVPPIFVD